MPEYNSPIIAGVSQVSRWTATTTVDEVLTKLGRNSGNMMFTESLNRVLKNSESCGFSVPEKALSDRDAIVLAAANWINEYEDFGWLYELLNKIPLPVFLVGVGAQSTLGMPIPNVKPGTLKLLKLVEERSHYIGVRGEFSLSVLEHYGIKSGFVTGCPSMLLAGRNGPNVDSNRSEGNVVVHATRHGFDKCDVFQQYLYSQAFVNKYDILLQSEAADVYYALGKTNNEKILESAFPAVSFAYGVSDQDALARYLRAHGLFYTNYKAWATSAATKRFFVGTRIHGTVASILSGTPALLIAHDSRTLELAKTMNIPFIKSSTIDTSKNLDISSFISLCNSIDYKCGYDSYKENFLEFFRLNGLSINDEISLESKSSINC